VVLAGQLPPAAWRLAVVTAALPAAYRSVRPLLKQQLKVMAEKEVFESFRGLLRIAGLGSRQSLHRLLVSANYISDISQIWGQFLLFAILKVIGTSTARLVEILVG
jgi:hypothetical protein